jgi:TolB-like protein
MKKYIKILMIIITILIAFSCASTPKQTGPDTLDLAIRYISLYLETIMPSNSKVAILNIQSDYNDLSEYIVEELIAHVVDFGNYSVIDRVTLNTLRLEQAFQVSGEVDETSAIEIGKFLGVQYVVTGAISELGNQHRIRIKTLNVQTAEVIGQNNRNVANSLIIPDLKKGGKTSQSNYALNEYARGNLVGNTTNTSTTTTTTNTNNNNTQITNTPPPVPVPTGPKPGVYTFWPRLQPTRSGVKVNNVFIPQITVTKDFIVIYFCRNATGTWASEDFSTGISSFYYKEYYTLQDIENTARFFTIVDAQHHSNGMGGLLSISYKYFNATKLKMTGMQYGGEQPFVFEEIDFSKALFE